MRVHVCICMCMCNICVYVCVCVYACVHVCANVVRVRFKQVTCDIESRVEGHGYSCEKPTGQSIKVYRGTLHVCWNATSFPHCTICGGVPCATAIETTLLVKLYARIVRSPKLMFCQSRGSHWGEVK